MPPICPAPRCLPAADSHNAAPRRHVAALEVIASAALMFSTVVAVTAVSIGIARADTLGAWRANTGSLDVAVWTVATLVILSGLSGLITWLVQNLRRGLRSD